jgi:hypothetical protein
MMGAHWPTISDWQDLERTDILDWVGIVRHNWQRHRLSYLDDAGNQSSTPGSAHGLKSCLTGTATGAPSMSIRPTICRQYPGSRKHARMTGCRGVLNLNAFVRVVIFALIQIAWC